MKIAVEGCMHGELDKVYATLQHLEKVENTKIDLLLCCQAARDDNDLKTMAAPPKYRVMNSFWKYFSGQAVAPYPTIFIGGNHEASNYNYLWELFYGGYAAPNIYFLGFAGVVKFGSLRIGGLSGTYYTQNDRLYRQGHFERPPYDDETIKSVNHVREYDVRKLMQLEEPLDVFLSHDWPRGITRCGDWKELKDRYKDRKDRYKDRRRRFVDEVEDGTLGSVAGARLLEELKPAYWFSAHMHCKFSAIVQHGEGGPCTKFLALDKCVAGREFLQIVEIESEPGPYEIRYDEEWLGITRRFNSVFPLTERPADFGGVQLEKEECRQWVESRLQERGSAKPYEFVRTVSDGSFSGHPRNPQTESLLQLLGLPYLLDNSPF